MRFVAIIACGLIKACATTSQGPTMGGYDQSSVQILTYSLFNQITEDRSMEGDWILRRKRLRLLDQTLRELSPNVLLLQEVMQRQGSKSDSDVSILTAGAMSDSEFYVSPTLNLNPSYEIEALAVGVGVPTQFNRFVQKSGQSLFQFGSKSFAQFTAADLEGSLTLIVNVNFSDQDAQPSHYLSLAGELQRWLNRSEICPFRVIVGGHFPYPQEGLKAFTELTQLKDTGSEKCLQNETCLTSTSLNEFNRLARGEKPPSREDFIFVHRDALVFSAEVQLNEAVPINNDRSGIGRTHWASERAAWRSTVRLPYCKKRI